MLIAAHLHAQPCNLPDTAEAGPTLVASLNGNNNRSAVVWNPDAQLYYGLDAGSSGYAADTYDANGAHIDSVPQGFDYRGAWWNPATGHLEGNGFSTLGIWVQNLDPVTHHPLGTGTVVLPAAQPDAQSVGTLDPETNTIIYYYAGMLYRYDRTTNAALGTVAVTGFWVMRI